MALRRQLTFLVILGAAFAWGYFGDVISIAPAPQTPIDTVDLAKPDRPKAPAAESANQATPAPVIFSGPPPRPPGAEVPARQLTPPTGSLANTLDSIQPGKAQDTQIEQRNAYFDRLSQQLKALNTTGNGAVAPLPGAANPPENPYGAPPSLPMQAPVQIQADPIAPPGLEANEEPDSLEEEEADDADLDPLVDGEDGEEDEAGMEP